MWFHCDTESFWRHVRNSNKRPEEANKSIFWNLIDFTNHRQKDDIVRNQPSYLNSLSRYKLHVKNGQSWRFSWSYVIQLVLKQRKFFFFSLRFYSGGVCVYVPWNTVTLFARKFQSIGSAFNFIIMASRDIIEQPIACHTYIHFQKLHFTALPFATYLLYFFGLLVRYSVRLVVLVIFCFVAVVLSVCFSFLQWNTTWTAES